MKDKIAKLIDVKSIVTIILTGMFAYLAVVGKVSADQVITIYTMIISFYFGIQSTKKDA